MTKEKTDRKKLTNGNRSTGLFFFVSDRENNPVDVVQKVPASQCILGHHRKRDATIAIAFSPWLDISSPIFSCAFLHLVYCTGQRGGVRSRTIVPVRTSGIRSTPSHLPRRSGGVRGAEMLLRAGGVAIVYRLFRMCMLSFI